MSPQFIAGIITVACVVGIITIICQAADEMKKKQTLTNNIYKDIKPHQVAMMKKIFPNFDWVRIDREIAKAQQETVSYYEPEYIDGNGVVQCKRKRIDNVV